MTVRYAVLRGMQGSGPAWASKPASEQAVETRPRTAVPDVWRMRARLLIGAPGVGLPAPGGR